MKTSASLASGRRQPARSTRTSTTRPSHPYARPSHSSTAAPPAPQNEPTETSPPGFFPAITHFTDGLAALPKEVMRHFTLIKETEGKVHLHQQAIGEILDDINKLPNPPRQPSNPHQQPLLGLSLTNSLNGSTSPSIADGSVPATQQTWTEPTATANSTQPVDEQFEARRATFLNLRQTLRSSLGVLDEKNMVLASANDTLSKQLARLDNVLPHVENEVSEEARLGSNTHWALAHMREAKKAAGPAANDKSRRDVQNANSLAAAAAAIHEGDIAAIRSETRREALMAKRRANVDSDFDDRPTKRAQTGAKSRKLQDSSLAADGKASGPAPKRRRVDKTGGTAMERSASGAANGKGATAAQRDRDRAEPARKKAKTTGASSLAKERRAAAASPSVATSPTRGTLAPSTNKDISSSTAPGRANNPRGRQNSAHSTKSNANGTSARSHPPSAALTKSNQNMAPSEPKGASNSTGQRAAKPMKEAYRTADGKYLVEEPGVHGALAVERLPARTTLKREETEPVDDTADASLQTTNNAPANRPRGASRAAKPDTPVDGSGAADPTAAPAAQTMARSRSTRGANTNARGAAAAGTRATHSPGATAGSPRRTAANKRTAAPHANSSRTSPTSSAEDAAAARANYTATGGTVDPIDGHEEEDDDEEEIEINPDQDMEGMSSPGSDEPRYCICNGPSYGHMIGCDNEECPREWFHLSCVGMTRLPGARQKWYCDDCKELMRRRGTGSAR